MDPLQPPWPLSGRAAACLTRHGGRLGLRLLVDYHATPVGSYLEDAVVLLDRAGPSVVAMAVNSGETCSAGRALWGFPKTLAELRCGGTNPRFWFGHGRELLRFRAVGPSFSMRAPFVTVQTHLGERVRVPGHAVAQVRLAWRGRQMALLVTHFEAEIGPPQRL